MASERKAQRTTATVERRPVSSAVAQRSAAPAPVRVNVAAPVSPQLSQARRLPTSVSKPTDPAEREAEDAARKVMRMTQTPATPVVPRAGAKGVVQRVASSSPSPSAAAPAPIAHGGAGAPLSSSVRGHMEPRFGASLGHVRVHTGDSAAKDSASLNANAFTVGQHIYFGKDKFQPQSSGGQELIAHEVAHTIQQGATSQGGVAHRSAAVAVDVGERVTPQVQRSFLGIPNPREYFAGKAEAIPGFTMLTVVIGYNPITNARVERNAGNILRAAIQLIPGGSFITDALNAHGVFDAVSAWVAVQFETLKEIGAGIYQDIESFIDKFSITDLADPGGLWDRAKAIAMRPIDRIIAFARAVKDGIVALIKSAILKPIAAFAQTTRGYPLLCAVMGKDPVTREPVPQDAESLLGAFMKFIGEDELWATMQKAKAVPRAFAWFKGALGALKGFIAEIPGLFVQAFRALEVMDIILIPRAFGKLVGVFGGFAVRFVTWGAAAVWDLLEIIFDVVSPGALAYIKKTGAALKSILRDPLPFVGNLVKAAKLGFMNFGKHFLDHLKAGLIDWLTGSLPGIYIPKAFSLGEIAKFVFSVLGLSWASIREKLVTATSETAVKAMETGFKLVVTLVQEGPAAAWDLIKEQLANLKDMVIGGITDFVVDMVVKQAIPKMIAMFIPGAGFLSAILSIYDTVMVFVNKIKQIVQVVTGFVDSIVAIAAGQIGEAATRVETSLAGVLSLAINFLAGFAGLGKVADKVMVVINKIRAPIDKALNWLVGWIVKAAKSFVAKGKAAVGKLVRWAFAKTTFKDAQGKQHSLYVSETGALTVASTPQAAREFVEWYVKQYKGDPRIAAEALKLILKAEALVAVIEKTPQKDPNEPPAPAKQQELLGLSNQISTLLSQLIDTRSDVGKSEEKYLLEGQVGTYATIPKPVGDKLTPDHQPQASIIVGAGEFFQEQLGIADGPLAARAFQRANQGFAINLHFKRHVAGATYGSKGETKQSFKDRLIAGRKATDTKDQAKAKVVAELRTALKKDAKRMRDVAALDVTAEPWKQLKEDVTDDARAKALKTQIADRIVKGENQIESQPFDF